MQPLKYTELIRSGQKVDTDIFAQIKDTSGAAIPHSSTLGSVATITGISDSGDKAKTLGSDDDLGKNHSNTMVSNMEDFVSLLKTRNTASPNTVWSRCASRG